MKTQKGTVAIEDRDKRLHLRWSFAGDRYCLSLGLNYNKINLKVAQQIASKIELDILSGNFDPSLDKYSPSKRKPRQPLVREAGSFNLLEAWDLWVDSLELSERTKNKHYALVRSMISKQTLSLTMRLGTPA
jgi:integrase